MAEYRCMICQKLLTNDDKSDQVCLRCCKKYGITLSDSITDIKKNLLKNIVDEPINVSHSLFSYLMDTSVVSPVSYSITK